MKDNCTHDRLHFGSGAYYIFCVDCDEHWVRHVWGRSEYGRDAAGNQIGAEPGNSGMVNAGAEFRIREPRP